MNENVTPPGIIRMRCHTGHETGVLNRTGKDYDEWYLHYCDEYKPVEIEVSAGQRFSVGDRIKSGGVKYKITGFEYISDKWMILTAHGKIQISSATKI